MITPKFRAIDIQVKDFKEVCKQAGLLNTLYSIDIFICNVPVIKSIILLNIIVWIIFYFTLVR